MTRQTFMHDFSAFDLESRKQGGRAVPFVIVGHRSGASPLERQARLRAIQGLDLTLFVHTEHHGALRRLEIEPYYRLQLFYEMGILRELESLDPVRLETVGAPDSRNRGLM